MCDAPPPHDGTPPPPGEAWCPARLDIETYRALTGYPFGAPGPIITAATITADLRREQREG